MGIISISLSPSLLEQFDRAIAQDGFSSRSEALRELMFQYIDGRKVAKSKGTIYGAVVLLTGAGKRDRVSGICPKHRCVEGHLHFSRDGTIMHFIIVRGAVKEIEALTTELRKLPNIRKLQSFLASEGV